MKAPKAKTVARRADKIKPARTGRPVRPRPKANGTVIRDARLRLDLSADALAEQVSPLIGVRLTGNVVLCIERGTTRVPMETLLGMCSVLQLSISDVVEQGEAA